MAAPDRHGLEADRPLPASWPETVDQFASCPGPALCSRCFWARGNGGLCPGCNDEYRGRCLKGDCGFNCDTCGGGRHARTPGCCGRTAVALPAWKERLREILETPIPKHSPGPLPIRCRLVPVIYAQLRHHRIPERFPQIDAWATPIHKLADLQGNFRSSDLKDYLGLPPDRKLIVSTCAPDDFQEMLWHRRDSLDYAKHGADFWFPGHFSVYDNDSKLYQYLSLKRQLIHGIQTRSQFAWFRLGDAVPLEMLEPIRESCSALFSSQQTFRRRHLAEVHAEIEIADGWFPERTAFFVVGGNSKLPLDNGRRCYRVNSRWQLLALKGRDMNNKPAPEIPRLDLLTGNLERLLSQVEGSGQKDEGKSSRR